MAEPQFENILIVRTDRIGDVVLALPLIDALRSAYPSARISFLVRLYTKALVEGHEHVSTILTYDHSNGPKSFWSMLSEIRKEKFDLAIVAYPRFRIAFLLWLAGIPARVGTGYRWYSFLLNRRVYEHRKSGAKHEFELNLSLLRVLGDWDFSALRPRISISQQAQRAAVAERERLGLRVDEAFAILHPGSGGSARDWSPVNFGKLARELNKEGLRVVVTGVESEENLVNEVVKHAGDGSLVSLGRLNLQELAAFIQSASVFVSNSTGPLHIAAAVGTPVVGFYPPIPACRPERWGPVTDAKAVFVPDRDRCRRCKGGPCQGVECMDQIEVPHVMEAIHALLKSRTTNVKTSEAW